MKADAYELKVIFGHNRQLFAPLFQRPYVWNEQDQWEPLWSDIKRLAEKQLNGEKKIRPHFMGAIVLEQLAVPVGKPDARSIIDGQQRVTTLQLFMAAFRDLCRDLDGADKMAESIELLIFNQDPIIQIEDDRFKVWPTNVDRSAYRIVMKAGSPKEAVRILKVQDGKERSQVVHAYEYFYKTLRAWIGESENGLNDRLQSLYYSVRDYLKIVVIDMDDEDDAQVIFETLNARGTPLLPSDLVKNFLFHKASEEGADTEYLYENYWKPFDTDDDFWREEMRVGRILRPRIDIFLQHYLALMRNEEISTKSLFREYQEFADSNHDWNAEKLMESFRDYARHFKHFLTLSKETREGMFFHRMRIMDTTTVFPFLLGLYEKLGSTPEGKKKIVEIIGPLESFLVRRMVCRLTAKNYNRLFLDLVNRLNRAKNPDAELVVGFLAKSTADTNRWPDDEEFKKAWLEDPLFNKLKRDRMRLLLYALDARMLGTKTEEYYLREGLTVEHILPQEWEAHWPLPDIPKETPEQRHERRLNRNTLLHTIGNLTFLKQSLNSHVSNGRFPRKKEKILEHSAINLNRFLLEKKSWDERDIKERGGKLFTVAKKIWPGPEGRT